MAKPVSGTALDTGHALYTSLLAVWGFLEGSGNSIDSKGSNNLTLSGGAWSTDAAGDACYSVTAAAASPCALTSGINLAGTSSWSVAWRSQKTTDANTNGMVCGNNDSGNFIWENAGTSLTQRSSTSDFPFTGATSFTAMDDWVLTFNPAGGHPLHLYKNGVEVSGSPLTGLSNQQLAIATLMAGFSGATLGYEGKLSYFNVWDGRELTSTEAGTLHATPYVIFLGGTTTVTGPFRSRSLRPALFKPGQRRTS